MKNLVFIFLILTLFGNKAPQPPKTITLAEAVKQDLIQLDAKGNANSPHYSRPIKLTVKNLKNSPLMVKIPNGQQFKTVDPDVQDMLVVKSEQLALAPLNEKTIELNAMCTQKENRAPRENEAYSLGTLAESHLLEVSNKIQEMEAFNTIGQYSVWSISNNLGLDQISGFNETEAEELKKYVSAITGRAIPEKDTTGYLINYNRPSLAKRTIGGKFEYGLASNSAVTIGLFNEQNIVVRELLNNPNTPKGDHNLSFEFDMAAFTDPVYFVQLIIDGEIKLRYKIEA